MKIFLLPPVCAALCCVLFPAIGNTQAHPDSSESFIHQLSTKKELFETDEGLAIKLTGNIHELLNDKSENPKYHLLILSYKAEDGNEVSISAEVKTRGHFRKT